VTALLAISDLETTTFALAVATGFLALIALFQLIAVIRSEGRREQPVVLTHIGRELDNSGNFGLYVTNEGSGTAFNVRYGVRIDGTEFPIEPGPVEYPRPQPGGYRRLYLPAGARDPKEGASAMVNVPVEYFGGMGRFFFDASIVVLFARYENAFGKTWESAHSQDTLRNVDIKRRRSVGLREHWQARRRYRAEPRWKEAKPLHARNAAVFANNKRSRLSLWWEHQTNRVKKGAAPANRSPKENSAAKPDSEDDAPSPS
jgi:hypothetical protein